MTNGYAESGEVSPRITVVYPKADQVVQAVDSTFILGNISAWKQHHKHAHLFINGEETTVHKDGGFLAFLPITPGEFTFRLQLCKISKHDTTVVAEDSVTVLVPEPVHTLSMDTLQIVKEYQPPSGDLVLSSDDRLELWMWGTPGCAAWFSLQGVNDSVPMLEAEPQQQPYWGEAVFGVGAVPESLLVRGIYRGFVTIPSGVSVSDTNVAYHLAAPSDSALLERIRTSRTDLSIADIVALLEQPDTLRAELTSSFKVSVNRPDYPFTCRITDSVQIFRHGPRRGYFSIFQPRGVEALVVGREGGWYRAQLSETQYAWIDTLMAERLPQGVLPPESLVRSVRTYAESDKVTVEIALKGMHPFRVIEDDSRTLILQLFGVTSDTDWIRYDASDSLIEVIDWFQPEPGMYQLRVRLNRDTWGYDTYYQGNTFYLQINRPPERVGTIYGKTIVIDPGHSSDLGSVGPTGYPEKDANLGIALVLAKKLRTLGAHVIMTRNDNSHIALYDRPMIAKEVDADLFISIHNNALPDGVNPFDNNGTSCYYYHPHSMELARAIHKRVLRATGLLDHGLYYGNLAVNRPTQYPAVLIECTFMMLPDQEARLKTDRFRYRVADAVVDGIDDFLEAYDDGN